MSKYDYFTDEELSCKCGCGAGAESMNEIFMGRLIRFRESMGFPFLLHSAYRCPNHPVEKAKGKTSGAHPSGRGVDVKCSHVRAFMIMNNAAKFGFTGIGISQKGDADERFIHLDDLPEAQDRPRPHVWSY